MQKGDDSQMKVIYLIRHGQASFGQANYDQLSDLGMQQSALLGPSLLAKVAMFDRVEQGSLMRHQQTLENALGNTFPVVTSNNWNEFDHRDITQQYLVANNMSGDDFLQSDDIAKLQYFTQAMVMWVDKSDKGQRYLETWPQFKQRIAHALQQTIESTQKSAVVFTSGGAISVAIGQSMQLTTIQTLTLNLQLVNTGITKLLVSSHGIKVSTFNEYVHLEQTQNKKFITYK